MTRAKNKIKKLNFNLVNKKLIDFLDERLTLAKCAFEFAASANIEQFIYAKFTASLKKSVNWANLENRTYEQIVKHLKKIYSWMDCKLLVNFKWTLWHILLQNYILRNTNHHVTSVKSQDTTKIKAVRWNKRENKLDAPKIVLELSTLVHRCLLWRTKAKKTPTTTTTKTTTESTKSQKLTTHSVRQVKKFTILQKDATLEPTQWSDRIKETSGNLRGYLAAT